MLMPNLRLQLRKILEPVPDTRGIAFEALALMEAAQRCLDAYNDGLRIGRDDAQRLAVSISLCAQRLRLLEPTPTALEVELFTRDLRGHRIPSPLQGSDEEIQMQCDEKSCVLPRHWNTLLTHEGVPPERTVLGIGAGGC